MAIDAPFGTYAPTQFASTLLALTRKTILGRGRARKAMGSMLRKHSKAPLDVQLWGRNARIYLKCNNSEMKAVLNPALYSQSDFAFLRQHLPPNGTFLDVGANAGMFSLFASSLLRRGGVVIAVEPQPDIFARLLFNISAANDLDAEGVRAILAPVAVGPQAGTGHLFVPPEDVGKASMCQGVDGQHIAVPMIPLGELLRREHIERVDVMKIDIEGFEDAVLQTFFENEHRSLFPRAVLIEDCNSSHWRWNCVAQMQKLGYRQAHRNRANAFLVLHG